MKENLHAFKSAPLMKDTPNHIDDLLRVIDDIVSREEANLSRPWCFFCERETDNKTSNIVPVLLKGKSASETNTITSILRCNKCKELHGNALNKVGWFWAVTHILVLSITISCLTFIGNNIIFRPHPFRTVPENIEQRNTTEAVWFFVSVAVVIIAAAITERIYDRDQMMRKLLGRIKPPADYLKFPQLVEHLQAGEIAMVSWHYLYGYWYFVYDSFRGLLLGLGGPSIEKDHRCYPAKLEREILSAFAAYEISNSPLNPEESRGPTLTCSGCGKTYRVGEDAAAASIEHGMSISGGAVVLTDGEPPEREDLVSSLEGVPIDKLDGARIRAKQGWLFIRNSLSRGEQRNWTCGACKRVNAYASQEGDATTPKHEWNTNGFCIYCGWERDFALQTKKPCVNAGNQMK